MKRYKVTADGGGDHMEFWVRANDFRAALWLALAELDRFHGEPISFFIEEVP